jgi:hypothetical protein
MKIPAKKVAHWLWSGMLGVRVASSHRRPMRCHAMKLRVSESRTWLVSTPCVDPHASITRTQLLMATWLRSVWAASGATDEVREPAVRFQRDDGMIDEDGPLKS